MNNNNYLLILKHKLTITFTLLVFVLSFLLWAIFFVSKYYSSINFEKRDFIKTTQSIHDGNMTLEQLSRVVNIWDKILERSSQQNSRTSLKNIVKGRDLNFLVVDRTWKLVYRHITWEIPLDSIWEIFELKYFNQVIIDDGFIIEVSKIYDLLQNEYDIVSFKKLHYWVSDLTKDLLWFILIIVLFSIVFYIIWFRFAQKNIAPIEQNIDDMKNFIHNAGHELKTPIAVVRWNLQIMWATKSFEKDLIEEGILESDKLSQLIDGLIELSDITSTIIFQKLDLKSEIDDIVWDYSKQIDEKNISLTIKWEKNLFAQANKDYFYILFSNILGNAIKYTQEGGEISLIVTKTGFIVKDNGMWIESYNLDKIFDRFFQADKSRHNHWFGIGLSLVKKIIDIFKWKIQVKSQKAKGTSFIITVKK